MICLLERKFFRVTFENILAAALLLCLPCLWSTQKYDPDPAAKAAAATVLASKLGADSGLKVHIGDESKRSGSTGKSKDHELVGSSGLRSRKQVISRSTSPGTTTPTNSNKQSVGSGNIDHSLISMHNNQLGTVVGRHQPQGSATQDGGWIARIVALLVGEDPRQSYALICVNCHMHNGEWVGSDIFSFSSINIMLVGQCYYACYLM